MIKRKDAYKSDLSVHVQIGVPLQTLTLRSLPPFVGKNIVLKLALLELNSDVKKNSTSFDFTAN